MLHLTKKKVIIFLVIFAIICIGITTALIIIKNSSKISTVSILNEEKTEIIEPEIVEPDQLGIKELTDTCYVNSLSFETINYHEGEEIYEGKYPLEIYYIQISGLKDKKVQEKINNKIKETVFAQVNEKEKNDKEITSILIEAYQPASFSNVLSIRIDKTVQKENEFEYSNPIGLNFNLQTGEQITFSDLFTNVADTKSIVSQAAYTSIARDEGYKKLQEENIEKYRGKLL